MTRTRGHIPIRTCIACGKKRSKRVLRRLVLNDSGEVLEDPEQRMQGRGAYVCDLPACRERLYGHRKLHRVFRVDGPVHLKDDAGDA